MEPDHAMTTLRQLRRLDVDLAHEAWSFVSAWGPQGADAEELP
jgi:hypothetical protein